MHVAFKLLGAQLISRLSNSFGDKTILPLVPSSAAGSSDPPELRRRLAIEGVSRIITPLRAARFRVFYVRSLVSLDPWHSADKEVFSDNGHPVVFLQSISAITRPHHLYDLDSLEKA